MRVIVFLEGLVCGTRLVDAKRDLVGDTDAVAFQSDNFFRVVGEDANVLEAKIDQDLRADAAFMLNHALARGLAIKLAALVEMNLREHAGFLGRIDTETAAGVVQIEKNAAVFLGDGRKGARDKFAAIARGGSKDISSEAVGMDAYQRRLGAFQFAAY